MIGYGAVAYTELYAQVLALFRRSYKFCFDSAKIENLHVDNETFRIQSPEEKFFFMYFRQPQANDMDVLLLSSLQILQHLAFKILSISAKKAANNLSMILRKYGFEQVREQNRRLFRVVIID